MKLKFAVFGLLLMNTMMVPTSVLAEDTPDLIPGLYYYRLYPDIVTNLYSLEQPVYMQVRVELQTTTSENVKTLELHEPMLYDYMLQEINFMMPEELSTTEQREAFRKRLIEPINRLLFKETGQEIVKDVSFTRFVIE